MKKSNFSLILFFLLFFSSSCDSSIFFSHEKEFSIYCINDFHGKVQSDSNQSGITKLSTYFKDKNDDNLILLSAGDMWQGGAESNVTKGKIVIDWMNLLDFSAMTLGNHEFDWGVDILKENQNYANFPFLALNIYNKNNNQRVDFCSSSVMVEKDGIKFGIIGAIGDCYSSISSSMVEDYYFKVGNDLTNLVKQESNKLKEKGADFIIYIIHDGLDSFEANIANDNKQFNPTNHYDIKLSDGYVDLVFEGHSHQSYVYADKYGTYHLQGGGENSGISYVNVKYKQNKFSIEESEIISKNEYINLKNDVETLKMLEKYKEQIGSIYETIGYNSVYRDSYELTELVAQLYLQFGKSLWENNYNLFLGGGFLQTRSPYDLEVGDVNYATISQLFPFDNKIVLCSIDGYYLEQKFVLTSNYNYHIAYSDYGENNKDNIDYSQKYYIVTDTYTSDYAPNNLTVIEKYDLNYFARDLLAEYIKQGNMEK